MSTAQPSVPTRLGRWFGVGEPWQRPSPVIGRADVLWAVGVSVIALASLELVRSVGILQDLDAPVWVQWLAVVTASALLVARRRYPVTVAALAALHMVVVGVTMPIVMGQFTLQVVYFVALMSGVAWARDRRWMLVVVGVIVVVMFTWIALQFAVGNAAQQYLDESARGGGRPGLVGPVPAAVLLTLVINVVYFGGAVLVGQMLWLSARDRARLERQASTIAAQAGELRTRAVTEERLRIARELHDVVAHHVSVIGIQAAAARRVMDRDPDAAKGALAGVETSSREAVTSMRGLLGTLREIDAERPDPTEADRSPQPGLDQLPTLVASHTTAHRRVTLDVVEATPGAAARLTGPMAHSIHRTVQEALTNVEKHSTAAHVSVVVRLDDGPRGHAEVEVVDDGRPRVGSANSGLGQLGIRERAASHRGVVEIGPRPTGGYRVRVRYPWPRLDVATTATDDPAGVGDAVPPEVRSPAVLVDAETTR